MKHKILVVDDMPDVLAEARHLLSKTYEVHVARSGKEALECCREHGPFSVVLTDQGMPGMNGTEFLAHMRRGWPDTIRIMMTGYADLELAIEALHEGAIFRFLQKPIRPRELVDAVEGAVARFGRIREERILTQQLQFSRESLLSLTESLEDRLAHQIGRMRGLQRLALRLTRTSSLAEVAEVTASTVSKVLSNRAVRVCLSDEELGFEACAGAGGDLGPEIHEEPIRVIDGRLGMIQVADWGERGERLDEGDREALLTAASISAIAANNQLARHQRDLAHNATVLALKNLASNRDDETDKHLERMCAYSRVLAETMRDQGRHADEIDEAFLRDLEGSIPLHDIGKVGIPDSILLKPDGLEEAEWRIMEKHTTIGARTIRKVLDQSGEQGFLRMGYDIAFAHHEHWDGSGYPRGIAGADIPLAARIAAVADSYDALTSWRPYRGPWSHQEAVAHVIQESGKRFDPDVVEAFRSRLAEIDRIRARLADTPDDYRMRPAA